MRTLGREAREGFGGGLEEGFEVLVVDLGGASGGVVEFALF